MNPNDSAIVSQENISVVYAEAERTPPGSRYGPVIRSVYLIEYCSRGCGSVIINGKEFPVTAGSCYVLLPGDTVVHTSDPVTPREGYWCALYGVSISHYMEQAGITSTSPFLTPALCTPVYDLLKQLVAQWACRDAGAQLRQIACAYGILGTLLQNKAATTKSSLIDIAIGLMQTHYPNPLHVGMLADRVGLERTYFSEVFKQKTGLSPYQYLTRLRVQKACQLLVQGHSVAETSYLVGMEPHNFGRVFKKEIGITPSAYLRKRKQNANQVTAHSVRVSKLQD